MSRLPVFRAISFAVCFLSLLLLNCPSYAQISGTGAISGVVRDSAGAVIPGASVTATNIATGQSRQVTSSGSGGFSIQLLQPGVYKLEVTKAGFATSDYPNVTVYVTQITSVNAVLKPGATSQTVNVTATGQMLQTQSSTLGSVVTGQMVQNLPLVTRNYTQIITLSPGVASDVTDSGAFGRGNTTVVSAGTTADENNFQLNGVEINDLQSSGSFSGGVAIPNPDTIAEFKVQTSQYDASYGRNAGANVNVITKTGSNQLHGSLWEFFRNEALNANDYFRKQDKVGRAVLRQNQPGMTLGGPIKHDKAFFFVSYQSTRQQNGLDSDCSTTLTEPPITNDRSRAALGALFAAQPNYLQTALGAPAGFPGTGANVLPDGSNIAPQALALFNLKLPNGQYVIPTPQRIDTSLPFAGQGVSTISDACRFNEDQFMTNGDWDQSASSQWQARFFFANSQAAFTLPGANLGGETVPGFPQDTPNHYRNLSVTNNHIFSSNLLNQAEFGFHRTWVDTKQNEAFQYSDIGATVPAFDTLPQIGVLNSITTGGNGQSVLLAQNTFVYQDTVSWTHGNHSFRFGGGVTRAQDNIENYQFLAGVVFGTYPDALLGQSAAQNPNIYLPGLGNVLLSFDLPFLPQRQFRTLDYHAYAQDDYKLTPRLTLNLGFRFERIGDISDALGRNSNFDITRANPNPPVAGTLQGYVVGSNFKGSIPPGVIKNPGQLPIAGDGQNTLNPRVGFAWQLPGTDRIVLRGGYGMYHETPTGQANIQLLLNPPFAVERELEATNNGAATWAVPFQPFTTTFPSFANAYYSPNTSLSLFAYANNFRPAVIQHYSLNTQVEMAHNTVLEVGYLGTRGQHLAITDLPNQAFSASTGNPIRGQTTNTVTNILSRVPVQGLSITTFNQVDPIGSSWYNALLANFTKRFQNGSEAQIAYTWSSSLSDVLEESTGADGGDRIGNQRDPRAGYGPDAFARPNRLVANFVYAIPTHFRPTSLAGETLGGWTATGVVTIQAGHWIFFQNTNTFNAFGINNPDGDYAELKPTCTVSQINKSGSVQKKLNEFFNTGCFSSTYPVIGADGLATDFGNTHPGIARGPAQNNLDFALAKAFPFTVRSKPATADFRVELFNAFNTPQFNDPGIAVDSSTFGVVNSTAVSPRVMQLAVKFSF
jgi:Carboxypeptidase regulatory-like domain/TonB-dependent Receptor Plug Domain